MEKKYFIEVVINKEKLSNGNPVFVAHLFKYNESGWMMQLKILKKLLIPI